MQNNNFTIFNYRRFASRDVGLHGKIAFQKQACRESDTARFETSKSRKLGRQKTL
jgi:hypothetical protein